MANCSHRRGSGNFNQTPAQPMPTPTPRETVFQEPPVRRWPHPIVSARPEDQVDSSMHYICCALSYQNQLLGDIKALLERLTAAESETSADK